VNRKLSISFSGGETSGMMTRKILQSNDIRSRYDEIKVIFANTGQEREECLAFVDRCDKEFGFNTIWIEAVIRPEPGKGPLARVVSYETASRDGEPFEQSVIKYGIPNTKFPNCTRVLKQHAMEAYHRNAGWKLGQYDVAIGIRMDEVDRVNPNRRDLHLVYPCIEWFPSTKLQVNSFWHAQSFRLRLKGYEGICKWCWKKSMRKHMTLISDNPTLYDFPYRMEQKYGKVGPEFKKNLAPDYRRVFFRGNYSTVDLFTKALTESFVPAEDDATTYDPDFDSNDGCEESCEIYAPDVAIGEFE
jgi:hypothetical protein